MELIEKEFKEWSILERGKFRSLKVALRKLLLFFRIYRVCYKLIYCNRYVFIIRNLLNDENELKNVNIEVTTKCNRRCSFCPVSYDTSREEISMSTKLFTKIIDELKDIGFDGVIEISLFGEPLMDKRIIKFIKYIKLNTKIKTIIYTNGDLLTVQLAHKLINSGIGHIIVSQHDATPSKQIRLLKEYDWGDKILFKAQNATSRVLINRGGTVNVKTLYPISCSINAMVIRADGKVCLCCQDYYNEVVFGDVNNESIYDIWNKESYRNIRRELKRGIFRLPICKRCLGKEV